MAGFAPFGRPEPILGLVAIAAGWALAHQAGSDSVLDSCATRGSGFVIAVSLAGLAVVALGGLYSWRAWRGAGSGSGRSFLGIVGALLAVLAAFALVLQIAAGMILPPCFG